MVFFRDEKRHINQISPFLYGITRDSDEKVPICGGNGVGGGASHSVRRTLSSWLDREGSSLEAIQSVLNHEDPDTTIIYIEPWEKCIDAAFKGHLQGIGMPESLNKAPH